MISIFPWEEFDVAYFSAEFHSNSCEWTVTTGSAGHTNFHKHLQSSMKFDVDSSHARAPTIEFFNQSSFESPHRSRTVRTRERDDVEAVTVRARCTRMYIRIPELRFSGCLVVACLNSLIRVLVAIYLFRSPTGTTTSKLPTADTFQQFLPPRPLQ